MILYLPSTTAPSVAWYKVFPAASLSVTIGRPVVGWVMMPTSLRAMGGGPGGGGGGPGGGAGGGSGAGTGGGGGGAGLTPNPNGLRSAAGTVATASSFSRAIGLGSAE